MFDLSKPFSTGPGFARLLCTTALASGVLLAAGGRAAANPSGGTVVGGSATISQAPGTTTVTQSSKKAIIDWQRFGIDAGETTRFAQPGSDAIALNRVRGGPRSDLMGQLQANGQVWLVNPNGVLIGPNARIDVGGFLATTADIRNEDFMAGRFDFSIPSANPDAAVVNQGTITLRDSGLAALVAPHARNEGLVEGRLAQVVVAGAPTFALDFYGDGLINFQATSQVAAVAEADLPLAENTADGIIRAEGGRVLMTAAAAEGVVNEVIDVSGVVEAQSFAQRAGEIVLEGGDHGIVAVNGRLDASGTDADERGGTVKVLGEKVALYGKADVDVSGATGGGTALIGGNAQGKGPERNALRTYVAPGATIDADARTRGDGGKVIVWADETTGFAGAISARGGTEAGDGGFVEVSGKQHLAFRGDVDVGADGGKAGTLLLDPENIVIVGEGPDDGELADDGEILVGDAPGDTFTVSAGAVQDISGALVLQATNDISFLVAGDFNFSASSVTLTADADASGAGNLVYEGVLPLNLNTSGAPIAISAAGFQTTGTLNINSHGGDLTLGSATNLAAGAINTEVDGLGGSVAITAGNGLSLTSVTTGETFAAGDVSLAAGTGSVTVATSIAAGSAEQDGASVTVNAGDSITIGGGIDTGGTPTSGQVSLTAGTGSVTVGNTINTSGFVGGDVTITAGTGLSVGTIDTSGAEVGGNLSLTAATGSVNVASINTSADGAGSVAVSAADSIAVGGDIRAAGEVRSGTVSLTAGTGSIAVGLGIDTFNDFVQGGDVIIAAGNGLSVGTINAGAGFDAVGGAVSLNSGIAPLTLNTSITAQSLVAQSGADVNLNPGFTSDQVNTLTVIAGNDVNVNTPVQNNGSGIDLIAGNQVALNQPVIFGGSLATNAAAILVNAPVFRNNVIGQAGLQPGTGRFLLYSTNPANDLRGELSGLNRYNATIESTPETDPSLDLGTNYFLYSISPVLQLTASSASRTYGDPNPGLTALVDGLLDGDALDQALDGVPLATTLAMQASNVGTYRTFVDPTVLSSPLGYTLQFVDGALVITPAPVTVRVDDASRSFGRDNPAFTASFDVADFKLGDAPAALGAVQFATTAGPLSGPGGYAVRASGFGNGNYVVADDSTPGTLTVTSSNDQTDLSPTVTNPRVPEQVTTPLPTAQLGVPGEQGANLIAYAPAQPQLLPRSQAERALDDAAEWSSDGNRDLWGLGTFPTAAGPAPDDKEP
jgi:filamentous haemagglutinin family N-terminal domain